MWAMSGTRGFRKTRRARMKGFKNQVKSSDDWGANPQVKLGWLYHSASNHSLPSHVHFKCIYFWFQVSFLSCSTVIMPQRAQNLCLPPTISLTTQRGSFSVPGTSFPHTDLPPSSLLLVHSLQAPRKVLTAGKLKTCGSNPNPERSQAEENACDQSRRRVSKPRRQLAGWCFCAPLVFSCWLVTQQVKPSWDPTDPTAVGGGGLRCKSFSKQRLDSI